MGGIEPVGHPVGQAERIRLLTDPGAVKKVAPDPALPWTETEPVLPGPYPQWTGD